jgi:hypothetical protein
LLKKTKTLAAGSIGIQEILEGEDQISTPTDRVYDTLDPRKKPMLKGKGKA